MAVELVKEYSAELKQAFDDLLPQLSRSAKPLSEEEVKAFVEQPAVYLFIFRGEADDKILGMLSLATFVIPTGTRAWIEDVVVDNAARGQGAGAALVEAALQQAKLIGTKTVDLTSRPSREAANRLYQRCGFELRETNVYRYTLK